VFSLGSIPKIIKGDKKLRAMRMAQSVKAWKEKTRTESNTC